MSRWGTLSGHPRGVSIQAAAAASFGGDDGAGGWSASRRKEELPYYGLSWASRPGRLASAVLRRRMRADGPDACDCRAPLAGVMVEDLIPLCVFLGDREATLIHTKSWTLRTLLPFQFPLSTVFFLPFPKPSTLSVSTHLAPPWTPWTAQSSNPAHLLKRKSSPSKITNTIYCAPAVQSYLPTSTGGIP